MTMCSMINHNKVALSNHFIVLLYHMINHERIIWLDIVGFNTDKTDKFKQHNGIHFNNGKGNDDIYKYKSWAIWERETKNYIEIKQKK